MTETPDLETKAVELIEKFEALAVDIAPDALELGLFVARISAAQEIVLGLAGVVVAVFCLKYARKFWHPFAAAGYFNADPSEQVSNFLIAACLAGAGLFGGLGLAARLISIWPFVGIFYPEVWIAKQVLGW